MTCEELTERIKKYRPFNEQEEADKVLILDWIRNNKNAFFREKYGGTYDSIRLGSK